MSRGLPPLTIISSTSSPTAPANSSGFQPPLASFYLTLWSPSLCIWNLTLPPKVSHSPERPPPCYSAPLPTAVSSESYPPPWRIFTCPGAFRWSPSMWKTCHTWDRVGCVAPLLQYHYRVPHLAVHEVYPEWAVACFPPQAPSHRASNVICCLRELDPIIPGLVWLVVVGGVGAGVLQPPSPVHPVLGLSVGRQVPCCQFRVEIGGVESLEESSPVVLSLPCHQGSVGLCRVTPKRAAWWEIHAHHIGHIGVESHENPSGYQTPTKVGLTVLLQEPIVRIKKHCQPMHVPPKTFRASRARVHHLLRHCQHGDPVTEYHIYNHI